jgi:hypothetical protein
MNLKRNLSFYFSINKYLSTNPLFYDYAGNRNLQELDLCILYRFKIGF